MKSTTAVTLAAVCLCFGGLIPERAEASLFENPTCQIFGCVLVYNGADWELYVLTGATGRPATLLAASGNAQPLVPVASDTLERVDQRPGSRAGNAFGIDLDGDGSADLFVDSGAGDGFLDAGDRLRSFPVTATTTLSLAQQEMNHSFWIASNAPFAVHAQARLGESEGEFGSGLSLSELDLEVSARVGSHLGGLSTEGAPSPNFERNTAVRTLGDLAGGPLEIFEISRGTANANAAESLPQQMLHIQCTYRFEGYDLSRGTGEASAQIEYFIYNP